MRFFWFDWEDPKSSIFRGIMLLIGGGILVVPLRALDSLGYLPTLPDSLTDTLIGIVAFGSLALFLGVLTTALEIVSWLFGSRR